MSADGAAEVLTPLHVGELVIDGGTLGHILGTDAEQELAAVGAQCGSVVICRSSPSQKAAVVRMMAEYEMRQVCPLPTFSSHPFPLHHKLLFRHRRGVIYRVSQISTKGPFISVIF